MSDEDKKAECKALCLEFLSEFDEYVRSRYRCNTTCVFPGGANTIDVRLQPISVYLRFKPLHHWPANSIVIANIGFYEQRKGHGVALLKFLAETTPKYGIQSVGVEQTHGGDNIQGFVRKFGFSQYLDEKNWLISIEALKERLARLTAT